MVQGRNRENVPAPTWVQLASRHAYLIFRVCLKVIIYSLATLCSCPVELKAQASPLRSFKVANLLPWILLLQGCKYFFLLSSADCQGEGHAVCLAHGTFSLACSALLLGDSSD